MNFLSLCEHFFFHEKIRPSSPSGIAKNDELPRSSLVRRNRSVPLNSDDFLATGFLIQISSDEFRSVPMGSVDFQQIPGRNFAESTGTFPAETGPESCCKEIIGTQRSRPKTNGIYRIRCRKTKKTIGSDGRNSGPGYIATRFKCWIKIPRA